MNFAQLWFTGLINPVRAWRGMMDKPSPRWGFFAVLARFVLTALLVTLPLYLLGRQPFAPSSLGFLATNSYYQAQVFFLPLFGLGIWLLMSAVAHVALRLAGKESHFDLVLNMIGMGMLIPMPLTWAWDIATISLNWYLMPVMAISHSVVQLWETTIEAVGFVTLLRVRPIPAASLALAINVLYVAFAMIFVR
jgi:hypothetical protein